MLHPVREEWVQLFHFQKYNLSITIKEPPKVVKRCPKMEEMNKKITFSLKIL